MPADRSADFGRMTQHGESRIRHCIKYDLGGGYRLVTVRPKDTVFLLLFVGSHDDAERWLDANRGLVPVTRARDEALLTYAGNKSEIFSGMDAFFGESDAE